MAKQMGVEIVRLHRFDNEDYTFLISSSNFPKFSVIYAIKATKEASKQKPAPVAIPIAAVIQSVAEVVNPIILFFVLIIVPAPIKPIPTATEAATLEVSEPGNAYNDKIVKREEPKPTNI